ncbi:hypothetical protein MTHERMOG20_10430 [Moorella thermoacetica]|uniref:Uncharacterized protein n=3 Tax=Neomoorella thermoacetica TaxID=1525 RepID=A0A1D7XC87_NEOTH|nr:hypothetical protein [Moorella thermoacetica]AKX97215.1 hypothetical protein MOTHA_c18700 [Moorella thermoacetica]AOQ24520.1 hypothetical protein Maut_02086 [Moorella thermoacetica]OIQ09494.1 hypothetical protein MOOR_08780 [Moorella thermoacetica]OIQ11839.1 hypothetical protein MOOTH_12310 [Moorella thermoacetica]OIQ57366.1 hypothetical protein MOCA_09550 [Moorella thermoacetica]
MRAPIKPIPPKPSQYGIDPSLVKTRIADLPGMTSVSLKELFPDLPEVIYPGENGLAKVRQAAEEALMKVDMSMIKPEHSVNVLASHHGFTLLGGEPYAELLKAIKDVIEKRTGCRDIRLRAGVGMRFRETEEYIKRYGLDTYYNGKATGVAPVDQGIPIETEIGTLYGIKKVYDADWIVHAHHSDVREVHFHRQVDKAVKPFGMSYARIETRSTYHQNLGPRGANFVARAIFDSEFVQKKFAFAAFLNIAPNGVVGVDVDNDLYALNDRVTFTGCQYYGKIMTLFGEIDECIAALDFPCPVPYVFSAGVIYANFTGANTDLYDLDAPLPPYTWYTEAFYGKRGKPLLKDIPPVNPAIKMCVHNYAWTGYPSAFFAEQIPTVVVGQEQAELFNRDPLNLNYMDYATVIKSTEAAMNFAYRATGTRKVIIFDGAMGGINVSEPLAELLTRKAPAVSERVDNELLPKWLRQRGVDMSVLKRGA